MTSGVAIALVAVGCSGTPARPAVQELVDYYAPGIRIGDPVSGAARARYRLEVAPYLGYRDSTYAGPDGVRGLAIGVDEYIDDSDRTVSRGAHVTEVSLGLPDTQAVAGVRRRLDAALGAGGERCHALRPGSSDPGGRFRRLQWTGRGHGVVMASGYADSGYRFGWVSFGVEPSISGTGLEVVPCD